ncbi:hypothetical protein EUGRSUZ_L01946 [Eucalyptus grandis]|uniref:Helicase C-terminal domain-containing protein n=1 Tax=Eucalyptus grandis TaxID=71139 RepID=A0A058ZU36_EUCGR|nr:hypothetical protein EUGRSUZ_L01946 [Eucalyptus grandis]
MLSVFLDEVDILCSDEFEAAFQSIINYSPVSTQYLFGTALLVDIYNKIVEIPPHCEFLIDCSGEEDSEKTPDTAFLNKKSTFIQFAEETPVTKAIVFCNEKSADTQVLPFHATVSQELQQANMKEFAPSPSKDVSLFLVCSNRSLQGIDFTGVDHVILFDFPCDPSKYVCPSKRCWRERQSVRLCSWEASFPGEKDNGEKLERSSLA